MSGWRREVDASICSSMMLWRYYRKLDKTLITLRLINGNGNKD